MRNLLTIALVSVLLLSCTRDNDGLEQSGEPVSLNLELDLNLSLEKSDEANKGVGLTNKFSEFEHIFKDEVDLVFTSTSGTFSTTLTITPNDLSNTSTLVIPYGTYSWSISDEEQDYNADYFMRSYLPIFGSGQVEIYSSEVSIDLLVDTLFGLITVEKENVSSAKISAIYFDGSTIEKSLILQGDYFYTYALASDYEYTLTVDENVYDSSISTVVGDSSQTYPNLVYPKTHYNYILAFSDLDVNSITLKTALFTQYDYYLQPDSTGTTSNTCTLSLSSWYSDDKITQTVAASATISDVTFLVSTTCSETINYSVSGLPTGVSMEILEENTMPSITGTVSSSVSSGTYNYTITAFNSDNLNTATASGTVTGTIIVTSVNPIYLDENGVTIKAYDWAEVGDVGTINGVEYTIVDAATLRQMVANDEDVTKVVTSKITYMGTLFNVNREFNQDISSWDVSNVTSLYYMFQEAQAFNQNIGEWDVSNVTDMRNVFTNATSFNQDLSKWNVINVENMHSIFANTPFNQDISDWDVSNVTDMGGMFASNDFFNQPIGSWDTSNVTTMWAMFAGASVFNQPIGDWDTSNVTNMGGMFNAASSFNQDLSNWEVNNVINMNSMFWKATMFNQDLSSWCVSEIQDGTNASLGFSRDAVSWSLPKPIWGRCPNYETYVPDDNFEQALIDLGYDDVLDDYVLTSTISSVTTLYADRKEISDLTGIEDFNSLEKLYVEVNNLTSLDVSKNSNLTHLSADRNSLTCIELSENQYNVVLPNIYANSYNSPFWSRVCCSQDYNSIIYNVNCETPDMDNILYVTSSNDEDYTIEGKDSNGDINGLDPTLNFNIGDAIYFYIKADGNGTPHYFHLKTAQTIGTDNQIDIPSGTYAGLTIWKPTEAGTYYYQCRTHSGHGGTIIIN